MLFNHGWEFAKNEPDHFTPVRLPHDWLIEDPRRLYERGIGYYRRMLDADIVRPGQRLYIRFDGVYMDSTLFLNGKQIFEWKYGYTPFTVELTEQLCLGVQNELLLKVNYQAPNARWYTGAGIFRDVRLIVKNPCHFVPDGIYITTRQENGQWKFSASAEVEAGGKPYQVTHTLVNGDVPIVAWELENPKTYIVRSELTVDGDVTDAVETRIGFRSLNFTADEGFFLNGKHRKLKGVCLHGDLGALGGAVNRDALRRKLTLMKRMGVNAVRTAHNPPAEALMELADEMGILVMSEILDMWRRPKNEYDYARFFDKWIARDVAAWVRRDRNHPSLILWSVGNEIYDTHADAAEGGKTLRLLMDLVKKHDPDGNAPVTFSSNFMPWENTQKCADILKLVGYNYAEWLYAEHHQAHPDWIIFGGETGSTTQSRGIYHFPLKQGRLTEDDLQCSSLGNCTTSWGTKDFEKMLLNDLQTPYSLGQFIWAGQDYIGEPTPYHTKNSYFGHVDTAGFPKDSFHLIRAAWMDVQTSPVVHIYPYWDFSDGAPIDVRVCTNAEAVELFLNGNSLGRKRLGGRLIADWQLPYESGALLAVAYDGAGHEIARDVCRSFSDAEALALETEVYGQLRFVEISALDAQGNPVENCNRRVKVSVKSGRLLGLDSGDSTDLEPYQTDAKRMFSGKLLAIIEAEGDIEPEITAVFDTADIPVRKIALTADGYHFFAEIFPENATHRDLRWRVTNAQGIDNPYAALTVGDDGLSAVLVPKGDGEMYVRCSAMNGKECVSVTGWQRVDVKGLGSSCLDPYTFIAGGLYSLSDTELGNGNDNGVATLWNEDSAIGFTDLDFGDFGSDQVRVPLFPMENGVLDFDLWEGMPGSGGEKIGTLRYTLGSEWNVYKEAVYQLPSRLSGIKTICFVFHDKVHMKGLQFIRAAKAFSRLSAASADSINGDDFTVIDDRVENIGNNVSLVFRHMDFGSDGARRVALRWRSLLTQNSVQIQFADDQGVQRQMIELGRAEEYAEGTFEIGETITGMQTVTLIFLPGSKLDLDWMEFS